MPDIACPLSFAQQRLWFHHQLEPNSGIYHIPTAARLRGPLHVQALSEALNAVVARHEALRTTFHLQGEEPVQAVAERGTVALPLLDLAGLPDTEREGRLDDTLRAEARRPFDLSRDMMLRALLVRLAADDHVLLVTLHHIAADGWSLEVLTRELSELYSAHVEGRPAALPPLPIQYGDYAIWQRAELTSEAFRTQLAYWTAHLAGMPPTLQLPTARPRPSVQTYRGAQQTRVLSPTLGAGLDALSRRERVTLFITLLTAFLTLLQRYAGTDDVVVGTPVAGRRRVETEPLIGFFVNTLPLRTDLSGDPTFHEALARVRDVALGAFDHQDLPFDKLVEELRPERSLSWTPLVQVMFTVDGERQAALELPGLAVNSLSIDLDVAKFDLTAVVRDEPQGLRITLDYNADLYDEGMIRRMLGHYETLLQGVVANPEERLSELPLLADAERHQLVVERNATRVPFPQEESIASLFEAKAARTPEAVAVIYEGESLTYQELNRRANQLAHYLRRLGVRPEVAVGICLEPSLELIVGLLGILKAGGAYVPLDPAYPKERLAFMQEDAQVTALVTRRELAERLPAVTVPLVLLDASPAAGEAADDPPCSTNGEHLAYLMYTSGSTGRPKAVAVPHRAISRLVLHTNYVTITSADVVAQASNASFDAATFEIWGALLNGARLVVIPRDVVLSPTAFHAALDRHGVTILFLTTALFNLMARELPSTFRRLRTLLFGGETAEPRWVAEVLARGAPERLLHVYGPTEATTFACWYRVENVPEGATTIPIGGPISNTEVYVLDRRHRPVPIGVPGELHIGGPGVARGYHRRADLTAEKFIPDPFRDVPGARLYKTGDLVRYLADGTIEFLGRLDAQVKIRGHRIEPGEIEAALRLHPAVREVIVLPREDVPGNRYLVAYLVVSQKASVTVAGLREFLRLRLPSYMLPAHFVPLHTLPLTPNGKVDRERLPAPAIGPDRRGGDRDPADAAAQNAAQRSLVEIWEQVLEIRPVGIHDNFFDLGGHSLLAARLVARIKTALGKELPVSAIFQAPTVEELACLVRQDVRPASPSMVVPLQVKGTQTPLFCIGCPAPFVRYLSVHLGFDQPCYALAPHGFDGRRAPSTVEQMAAEYLTEIRSYQPTGPYYLVGFSFGGMAAFEVAQQAQAQGEEIGLLILLDPTTPASEQPPRSRPDVAPSPAGTAPFRDHVRRHWTRLRALGFAEKLGYARGRLAAKAAAKMEGSIGRALMKVMCLSYLGTGRRVPPRLRPFYFVNASREAARRYTPRMHRGRAVLFVAEQYARDVQRAWGPCIADGMETHVVDADHFGMLSEPHAQTVVERLSAYLHTAQSAAGDGTEAGRTFHAPSGHPQPASTPSG